MSEPTVPTSPAGTAPVPAKPADLRRTILGASVGNIIEQYDFAIYSSIAALVFGKVFFPELGTVTALLASFSTYAVGFLARPLGGVISGHFGDLYGRKKLLVAMLLTAGLATTLIGVIPTYASIGFWAPLLLVLLRFVQGVSYGGEYSGAVLMVNESAPRRRSGFYTGFVPASSSIGVVLANFVILLCALMPAEQFRTWGWRMPFLASIVLVVVGLVIRARMAESGAFSTMKAAASDKAKRRPVVEAIKENPKEIVLVLGVCLGFGAVNYVLVAWVLSYLKVSGLASAQVGLIGLVVGQCCYAVSTLVSSAVSDRVGRRTVMLAGASVFVVLAFPLFWLIGTGNPVLIWLAMALGLVAAGMVYGPMSSLMCELFATKHRYSGSSAGVQVGLTLGGGLSPLVATSLFGLTGTTWSISLLLAVAGAVCLVSVYFVDEPGALRARASELAAVES
ncbi:MFS transporter [Amycolatopsis orientalis]|uniref:MFS transporter n=1 Tax=Amycolatopsis orientalis TaxID=31958 RepID=UPI0003A6797D|nr:MFS transporter [Amycolatopsis orientalis]